MPTVQAPHTCCLAKSSKELRGGGGEGSSFPSARGSTVPRMEDMVTVPVTPASLQPSTTSQQLGQEQTQDRGLKTYSVKFSSENRVLPCSTRNVK